MDTRAISTGSSVDAAAAAVLGGSSGREANISISRLNREMKDIKDVSEGSFGTVKVGILEVDDKRYAVKQTKKPITGEGDLQQRLQEVYALSVCDHPNIMRYHDAWVEDKTVFVRTEWAPDGSVADFERPLSEPVLRSLLHQIASALHHLHSRHIAHRDVKPENILACRREDGSFVFKLCDFGLARPTTVVSGVAETGESFKGVNDDDGDCNYLSQEAFGACNAPQTGPKADIYALGVTCVELMGGDISKVRDGTYAHTIGGSYDPAVLRLIQSMTHLQPQERPDAFTVVCGTLSEAARTSPEVEERQRTIAALQRRLDSLQSS